MDSQMPWSRFSQINSQTHSQPLSQPSQSIESSRGPPPTIDSNPKASWDRSATEAFIRACVEEVHAGNRPGSYFNKIGWENIKKKFLLATNQNYTRVQLKNRWDALKKDWSLWTNLLRGSTGLGWDIGRGTVKASQQWWDQRLKQIPEAAKFKIQGPLLVHDQKLLFQDVVATGASAWTPSSGVLPPHMLDETDINIEVQETDINELEPELSLGTEPEPEPQREPEHDHDPIIGSDDTQQTNARSGPSRRNAMNNSRFPARITHKKQKKMSFADKIVKSIERMVDTFTSDSVATSTRGAGHYTIKECMDILYTMSGVEESDRLWMCATRLFPKPAIRELFLTIRTNEARLNWLQEHEERDMQRRTFSMPSAHASPGESHHTDTASSR